MAITEARFAALEHKVEKTAEDVAYIRGQMANGVVRKTMCDERHRGLVLRVAGAIGLLSLLGGAAVAIVLKVAF